MIDVSSMKQHIRDSLMITPTVHDIYMIWNDVDGTIVHCHVPWGMKSEEINAYMEKHKRVV